MKVKNESEVAQSCPTLSDPHGLQPAMCPWYVMFLLIARGLGNLSSSEEGCWLEELLG